MSINLMKRMESSVYSFRLTLSRIRDLIKDTIKDIDIYENGGYQKKLELEDYSNSSEFDEDDQNDDIFTIGRKVKIDLEYRKQQLQRLQEEVVDIEEMSSGISIMDLGLNEFRLDLLDYIKEHPELENAPHGMYAVVESRDDLPSGVIYVLRNVKNEVNINSQNRLHPFYMVYMAEDLYQNKRIILPPIM